VNLTTYDGVELGQLIINVTVYLTDPSHVGKLNTIRQETNPGNHDHKTPTSTALKCAIGDLRRLKKDYGL